MNDKNKKNDSGGVEEYVKNLTDTQLDDLLKQAMKAEGYTKFINYQGQEEDL